MVTYMESNGKYWVFEETDTQYLSVDGSWCACKSEEGARYVGRAYKTEKAAKKAAYYYNHKQ